MKSQLRNLITGSLLVAGTSIGGGMLGLPVATSSGGYLPSLLFLALSWVFMASTGLILGDICCLHGGRPNLVTLSAESLGKVGKYAAWVLSLFLFLSLIVAYLVGLSGVVSRFMGIQPSPVIIILVACFAAIALWPSFKLLLRMNVSFMMILIASYALFIIFGMPHVDFALLERASWRDAPLALPVLFTSFGFQGTVPSLAAILNYDRSLVRRCILIGSSSTFFIYILWQTVLLGVVPYAGGLEVALQQGQDAIAPLARSVQAPVLFGAGELFAFAAITTSLLGVGLGLLDFLADGLGLSTSRGSHAAALIGLILIPTTLIAIANPSLFLEALGFAGGIGCALLLGVMPLLIGIKKEQLYGIFRSKIVLALLFVFVFIELLIELVHLL